MWCLGYEMILHRAKVFGSVSALDDRLVRWSFKSRRLVLLLLAFTLMLWRLFLCAILRFPFANRDECALACRAISLVLRHRS